jgi:hypothetical protein
MDQEQSAPVIRERDVQFVGEPAELAALFLMLAKAQGEFLAIVKDSTAEVQMKAGGKYTFDYAGLDVLIAATQPALTKYELAFFQAPIHQGGALLSVLAHGKARIECVSPIGEWNTPQEFGSATTYAKRYARGSILSVFPSCEDDDGAKAAGHQATVAPRTRPNPPAASTKTQAGKDAITPETKRRVADLGRQAGFAVPELEEFSRKNQCGLLAELTEINGLRLAVALEGLRAQ